MIVRSGNQYPLDRLVSCEFDAFLVSEEDATVLFNQPFSHHLVRLVLVEKVCAGAILVNQLLNRGNCVMTRY